MEKLENKIEDILDEHITEHGGGKLGSSTAIAQEVKDIAIAFAKWKNALPLKERMKTVYNENNEPYYAPKEYDELFTDFIQTYYK